MKIDFCWFGETFKGYGIGILIYWGKEFVYEGDCRYFNRYINSKWIGFEWTK